MFFHNINLVVVIIAAAVGIVIGAAWYSPFLFAKKYMDGMGITAESAKGKNMAKSYSLTFLCSLITAYVLAVLFNSLVVVGGLGGILLVPFLLWLACAVPIAMNDYLWGNKSLTLVLINCGHTLVALSVMSVIIGLFQ